MSNAPSLNFSIASGDDFDHYLYVEAPRAREWHVEVHNGEEIAHPRS